MIERLVDRFQKSRVHVQVFALLITAPLVVALLALSTIPLVVDMALADAAEREVELAVRAVRIVVAAVVAAGLITGAAAAFVLRSFLRASIDQLRVATEAIAGGDFAVRTGVTRRDELGSLGIAIDAAAARLQRLEHARRELLACVSHELRTPVTIARGMAFTLARGEASSVRRARFELVDRELERLGALIEDLVQTASIHAGGARLQREAAHIDDVVAEACDRFADAAADAGVRLDLRHRVARGTLSAHIDVDRIQQVLGNLLANAIRHASPGSSIAVRVRSSTSETNAHVVEITNDGPPIPEHVRDTIFDPFRQHGDRAGAVGLGLAIARDLVEAHGGRLALCEADTSGTTFRIELPPVPARSRVEVERALPQRFGYVG